MDAGNPLNLFKTHGSGRQPRPFPQSHERVSWMSPEKWRIEEGWILSKMDGLQCSMNCPQLSGAVHFLGLLKVLRHALDPIREGHRERVEPVVVAAWGPSSPEGLVNDPIHLYYGSNVVTKMPIATTPPKTRMASTSERTSLIMVTSFLYEALRLGYSCAGVARPDVRPGFMSVRHPFMGPSGSTARDSDRPLSPQYALLGLCFRSSGSFRRYATALPYRHTA